MKLIIDIPEEYRNMTSYNNKDVATILRAVMIGTPFPKAKWQKKKIEYEQTYITEWQVAQCSNCKRWHTTPYMYYFYEYKYCPFCGAKMEVTDNADSN